MSDPRQLAEKIRADFGTLSEAFLSPGELALEELLAALDECRRERDEHYEAGRTLWLAAKNENVEFSASGSQPPRPEWADDPFLRYRDKILRTLEYISDKSGSGDYSQVIADMATELLGDLGVE